MANFGNYQPNINELTSYLQSNASNSSEKGDGPLWWNIPQGTSSVRILPPWDPSGRVALAVYSHRIEFQGQGMNYKKYSWTCVDKTCGKRCNICEGLLNLEAAGLDTSEYQANKRQFYFNAIVMFDPVYDAGIKSGKKPEDIGGVAPGTHVLMRAPKTLYDWVVAQITNPLVGDITSVEQGIDVYVTKEGSGLDTKYTATLSPNGRQAIPQEYLDKIENLYNLDEIFGTGFEDAQVNELVAHLGNSARALGGGQIQQVVQQMGGYQPVPQVVPQTPVAVPGMQAPVVSAPTPFTQAPAVAPTPVAPASPVAPAPPSPFNGQAVAPVQQPVAPVVPQPTVPQSLPFDVDTPTTAPAGNNPPCFGQYNASNVQCVVCSSEIPCSKASGK